MSAVNRRRIGAARGSAVLVLFLVTASGASAGILSTLGII